MSPETKAAKLSVERTLDSVKEMPPLKTGVIHPVKDYAIQAVKEAVDEGLILPTLIGPKARIVAAANAAGVDITPWPLIDTEHSHEAAAKGCEMAGNGELQAVMKGAIHSDELLSAVIRQRKLHTERRLSHIYTMEVKTYHKPFMMTDAAININPDLTAKVDMVENAISLWRAIANDDELAKIAVLAAVETVNPQMQATIDAASLCKMMDRGQLSKAIIDGPLAFDNAINRQAAEQKGIVSDVAGDPDILIAPNLESANIMGKQFTFISDAIAAGIVMGARVPVILTSRADSLRTRLLSCALAVKVASARQQGRIK
ncbi:MAG TPA: bifunctional enoyl-CoA hydratase/phosphate acetyltransferase [Alphaproteobacteria bacterium]|mgnify:CR=1 FL=1|nr:phosphate acetyltransferase [Rhodospirillaceae bacterium]HRJ12313.1 bifunctional enoyl-CoA hydratase/phosphate acetyltransferase [Alphaproteobacteria bacterium]